MPSEITPPRTYLIVGAILLALTLATVLLGFVPLGLWSTPVALTIAAAQAVLIAAFFMHLRVSGGLTRLAAAAALLWLGLMMAGVLDDILTRGWLPVPGH